MFAAPPVLVAFAEASDAEAAVPVMAAEVVALTEEETMVGVPDTAIEAADCLKCSMSINFERWGVSSLCSRSQMEDMKLRIDVLSSGLAVRLLCALGC
jgi:hypothetical protein